MSKQSYEGLEVYDAGYEKGVQDTLAYVSKWLGYFLRDISKVIESKKGGVKW